MAWLGFGPPVSSNIGTRRLRRRGGRGAGRPPSGHELAAVDLDDLPNDIGAEGLGSEEQIGADAFLGGPKTGNRNVLGNRLQAGRVRVPLVKRRRNNARRPRIDTNLLANQLLGVALGDRGNDALGGS